MTTFKQTLRFFLIVMAFFLEIRVQAEVLQKPAGCLQESQATCIFKTGLGKKFTLETEHGTLSLGPKTTLLRVSKDEFTLLEGMIWVHKGSLKITTEYGYIKSRNSYWLTRSSKRVHVFATMGDVVVRLPRQKDLLVRQGERNWFSGLDRKGQTVTGIPRVIFFKDQIRRWAALYKGSKKGFRRQVASFQEGVIQAVQRNSESSKRLVLAHREKLKMEKERRQRIRQRKALQNREMRDLFRRRNYLD